MKKLYLFIFILFLPHFLFSQNWQGIHLGDTMYMQATANTGNIIHDTLDKEPMRVFWVDSTVSSLGNTCYFLPKIIHYNKHEYKKDTLNGIWGECIIHNSTAEKFINMLGDTLSISTNSQINDTTLITNDSVGIKYFLVCDSMGTEIVYNISDSVRYYTIYSFYNNVDTNTYYHKSNIKLSKNFGFLLLPAMSTFPYEIFQYPYEYFNLNYGKHSNFTFSYPTSRISNVEILVQKNKNFISPKYQPGNQFIYTQKYDWQCPYSSTSVAYTDFYDDSLISITIDSVVFLRKHFKPSICALPTSYPSVYTVNILKDKIGYLDNLEDFYVTNENSVYYYSTYNNQSNNFFYETLFSRITKKGTETIVDLNYYGLDYFENFNTSNSNISSIFGLTNGHIYEAHSNNISENSIFNLLYAKIGTQTYGTQINIPNSIFSPKMKTVQLEVFPNPAKNEIVISNIEFRNEIVFISIQNAQGLKVFSQKTKPTSNLYTIDVSEFASGLYFISLEVNSKKYFTKFLKEN